MVPVGCAAGAFGCSPALHAKKASGGAITAAAAIRLRTLRIARRDCHGRALAAKALLGHGLSRDWAVRTRWSERREGPGRYRLRPTRRVRPAESTRPWERRPRRARGAPM